MDRIACGNANILREYQERRDRIAQLETEVGEGGGILQGGGGGNANLLREYQERRDRIAQLVGEVRGVGNFLHVGEG